MTEDRNPPPASGDGGDAEEARRKLAKNWASMTASMVAPASTPASTPASPPAQPPASPPAVGGPPARPDAKPPRAAPLPTPAPDSAQRTPAAPASPTPPQAVHAPANAAEARAAPPTPVPAPTATQGPAPATPAAPEPRLAPVSGAEARPQPVAQPIAQPAAQPVVHAVAHPAPVAEPTIVQQAPVVTAAGEYFDDEIGASRGNLTAAVSFTIFALVVALGMTFASQYSTNPAGSDGSGTLLATLLAVGLAWTISLAHRLIGRFWPAFYVIPIAVLLLGPFASGVVWQNNQESLARSYLSATGQQTMIDADANTIASTIVATEAGCFSIVRDRATKQTSVLVASTEPGTARQHADFALAPRFAAQVAAGGATSSGHVFFFDNGVGPPRVETPEQPPLDCPPAAG